MKSAMVRYLNDIPILPLAYIKHKSPKNKDTKINKYTPQGRELIHKNQSAVPEWKIQWLREHPVISQRATVEYNDNRISICSPTWQMCNYFRGTNTIRHAMSP